MRIGLVSCLVLLSLSLVACTSPHMSGEVEAGKSAFQAGNYSSAFQRLFPVARDGRPDAQYAIGYMYYYGYGVSQDTSTGLQWMRRSAVQGYPAAIKALDMIEHRDSFAQKPHQSQLKDNYGVTERGDVMNQSKKSPAKKMPSTPAVMTSQNTKSSRYVLQLFGDYKIAAVQDLQKQLHLANDGHVWHTKHLGRDWYILTTGHFDTVASANTAMNSLPTHIKSMHPWVRPTIGLEDSHTFS